MRAYLAMVVSAAGLSAQDTAYPTRPVSLPDSAEIALAASAAPREITEHATIYGFRDGKEVVLRRGTNGVTCMVSRDFHAGSSYPICYDEEGSRTRLPRELMEVRLRIAGTPEDEIDRQVAAAYASGALKRPSRISVAYMMSPRQMLFSSPGPEGRRVGAWHPHLMIQSPGLAGSALGMSTEDAGPLSIGDEPGVPELVVRLPTWSDGTAIQSGAVRQAGSVLEGATSIALPDTTSLSADERELVRVERRRSAAIAAHDTGWLATLYAPDFRTVAANGQGISRAQLLQLFTRDDPTTRFTIDELSARALSSDAALISGRLRATGPDGITRFETRYTHVYAKRDGRWQIVAIQASPISLK